MTITVIGVGLIGGSLAIGLKESGFAAHVIGVERNEEHAKMALSLRIVDEILPLPQAIAKSDIIIAATPVDSLTTLIPIILDLMYKKQTVIDVGSTKLPVLEAVKSHKLRGRFVGTHPMAGTEYSGPEAAVPGLFKGKCCVLCEIEKSDADALLQIEALYAALKMKITTLGGTEHDLHTAYVSHISHIASFALALTVFQAPCDWQKVILRLGFRFFAKTATMF
jgi:prephenate dehydrogenase